MSLSAIRPAAASTAFPTSRKFSSRFPASIAATSTTCVSTSLRTTKDSLTLSTYVTRQDNLSSDAPAQGRPIADLPFKPLNTSGTIIYRRIISATTFNEARFNATRFSLGPTARRNQHQLRHPARRSRRSAIRPHPVRRDRSENTPGILAQNIFEFSDTLTKVIGNHAFKFGGVFRIEQDNSDSSGGSRPLYSFSGLFNLANDTPIFEAINADPRTGVPADAQRYFRTNYYAAFMQDDWKVRPNLTLNLGLRYEYYSPLKEKDERLSNLFFGSQRTDQLARRRSSTSFTNRTATTSRHASALLTVRRLRFLGLGSETGDSTVIRGGFGIAYNRIPVAPLANVRGNPPFFARFNICCGTAPTDFGTPFANGQILYALGSSNSLPAIRVNPALGQGIDPGDGRAKQPVRSKSGARRRDLPNPYVYTYSLEMQQELPAKLTGNDRLSGQHRSQTDPSRESKLPVPEQPGVLPGILHDAGRELELQRAEREPRAPLLGRFAAPGELSLEQEHRPVVVRRTRLRH